MNDPARRVLVGRIVGVYGVHGEVKLESWTAPRERIFDYQPWLLEPAPGKVAGVRGRKQGRGLVAKLPGVEDRDQAAALVDTDILVARSVLPTPEDGSYYWADLEGLRVVTIDGAVLGVVSHVVATGANDVLVVRGNGKEHLVPFVRGQYVKEVDTEAGCIRVDWDPEF